MLVSFIIPVYNVGRYLSACLDSILNQGLKTEVFDIILVEDCSTDNSLLICRDYCSRYKNITLIENEKNIGPGLSRNKGITASQGQYLHFVDSDDFLFPDSLLKLLELNIISETPDVIRFGSNKGIIDTRFQNNILYKGKFHDYETMASCLSAWHYWFRRQYIIDNKVIFEDKKTGQDALFTFSILARNPFVVITSTVVYHYRKNSESITSNKDIRYIDDLFDIATEIRNTTTKQALSTLYLTEIYKDIVSRFYRSQRTWKECVEFKKKAKAFEQYRFIAKGPWYLQLSRVPLLLYIYLCIKRYD